MSVLTNYLSRLLEYKDVRQFIYPLTFQIGGSFSLLKHHLTNLHVLILRYREYQMLIMAMGLQKKHELISVASFNHL